MKKRMFICFLIVTMFILGFLISDVAFGQSSKLIDHPTYKRTLLREKVRSLLPDFLNVFNESETQKKMLPRHVNTFLNNPLFLRKLVPGTDDEFIGLLYVDKDFRTLFGADPFYTVLKSSREIGRLLKWFEALPPLREGPGSQKVTTPPRATILEIVSGSNQSGESDKPLAQPFVVGVLDQDRKPLEGTAVTFTVTAGPGRLSGQVERTIVTDVYGQARTTLTLGSGAGRHSVMARAVGITQSQTFTATATAPPPPPEPEPVVPVRPSTAEPPLPPMYWIEGKGEGKRIYHRPTGGRKEIFWEPKGGTLTGGLAVDTMEGKVYWTEQTSDTTGRIRSITLGDKRVKEVVELKGQDGVPNGITVGTDKTNKRWIYWTTSQGKIQRINVDGLEVYENLINGLKDPKHIAFDKQNPKLYWTEPGHIRYTYPNGTGGKPIFEDNLDTLGGIAVANGTVYWTEQTNDLGEVRSINGTGNGNKLLAVTDSIPVGIAVDADGERVYWTTADGDIQSVPLTGAIQTVVTSEMNGAGHATGIALGGTVAAPAAPAAPSMSPVVSVEDTLLANYPNPFNPETWIPYQLSTSADVSVSIYAVDGRLVRRLDLGHQVAGVYRSRSRAAYWDGRNEFGERVASGLYFYTLTAGDFTATRKMLIRK